MADDKAAVRETIAFMRMIVIGLREIAVLEPENADQLRDLADQCEREADELSKRFDIQPLARWG
jgi:hypothetical protein